MLPNFCPPNLLALELYWVATSWKPSGKIWRSHSFRHGLVWCLATGALPNEGSLLQTTGRWFAWFIYLSPWSDCGRTKLAAKQNSCIISWTWLLWYGLPTCVFLPKIKFGPIIFIYLATQAHSQPFSQMSQSSLLCMQHFTLATLWTCLDLSIHTVHPSMNDIFIFCSSWTQIKNWVHIHSIQSVRCCWPPSLSRRTGSNIHEGIIPNS